jgi:Pyridoxamine 5'-phosphate oxidase
MAEITAAKQKKWYDPTYSHGMSPEEIDAFLGSPDSNWLLKLAVLKPDGWPFVTPIWFQWRDGSFYVVGRKRSAWVQDLIRDPRCSVCVDEEAMPPAGGLRKVLARCTAEVLEGPVVAEGSQWEPVAREMARRYAGEQGPEGLKASYGWERYLVKLTPVEGGMTTWQGVGWAGRYLDPQQREELRALMQGMKDSA